MIKVNYNLQSTLVLGYYPDNINYDNIPEPTIEITKTQYEENSNKQMCVVNGVYQEYFKPIQQQIIDAKVSKIQEVKTKRDAFIQQEVSYYQKKYKANEYAKLKFFAVFNQGIFPIAWRESDDVTWVSLDETKAKGLANKFTSQDQSGYQQETAFLNKINEAKTLDEVNAIKIEYV